MAGHMRDFQLVRQSAYIPASVMSHGLRTKAGSLIITPHQK